MWKRAFIILFALILLGTNPSLAQPSEFRVDFTWEGTGSCFDPLSPSFSISNVPEGTKKLSFEMKDLDAPSYPHGGGTVAYNGQRGIPRGAFAYRGPCPPQGQHSYQWTVKAQDSSGKTLAETKVMKKFPPR